MARSLVIMFTLPPDEWTRGSEIHRIRNFGEDLYREFDASGLAVIELSDVDKATDKLVLRDIKSRNYGAVQQAVGECFDGAILSP